MRKSRWVALAAAALLALGAGIAVGSNGTSNKKTFEYAIGLWGDLPYSDAQAAKIPSLIDDMNRQQLAFSVNDGDLKQGSGPCPDSLYQRAFDWFNELEGAAMFTPGDNDWTDCDRPNPGVGAPQWDSRERLDFERAKFFSTDRSLGTQPMTQEVQTAKECLNANDELVSCVENRRWEYKGVMYATFNVQGSCNNLCDATRQHTGSTGDPPEWAARNQADLDWLNETFAEAAQHGDAAIMLISQADPGFDATDSTRGPKRTATSLVETDGQPDGFFQWLTTLRDLVIGYGKPVAYVHGDSHYFRVDKPLLDRSGKRVDNFTRVETFGDNQTPAGNTNDVMWVKALVDPQSRDVFAFQPEIIPENWSATAGQPSS
jgi:hypothetical protein